MEIKSQSVLYYEEIAGAYKQAIQDKVKEFDLNRLLLSRTLNKANISNLPPGLGDLADLIELNLSNIALEELSPEIGQLGKLVAINLSGNNLTSLPTDISYLINLQVLALGKNKFYQLPISVTDITSLETLLLNSNNLKMIPREIGRLTELETLDLSDNYLFSLPSEIGKLKNLRILNLSNNNIISLPPEIGGLEKLEVLDVSSNQLTELSSELGKLNNLKSLKANGGVTSRNAQRGGAQYKHDGNKISLLPSEILNLKQLRNLDLRGNPLSIPAEILDKINEPEAILSYYSSLFSVRKKTLNETKILVVGQGSVGKTSLVNRLLFGKYNQNQTKTDGININHWKINDYNKQQYDSQIQLNIWDFGGQEIMHATHQFFLTKRSLYLLILDARLTQEENRVEYWLKIIQSFGGDSPVLIVGNKTDQHPLDIDRTGLQKKYPNIVGILEASAATRKGIETLKIEVIKQVNALPHIHDLLPETWFTVKARLEEIGKEKNFITQDAYLDLCLTNGITTEAGQDTLIGFLHDLGVVLHFQDDPRLEALGILNPQWVTNGVYKILNSHELFENQGKLTLQLLNRILNAPEYPANKRLFIVDIMKKFELCYAIESDKSFLIPDLLPKDEPYTGDWSNALAFQIQYNVLPSSVISRFIVRMNEFIHKTVWRSGVILKDRGNIALVKADIEDNKIYIWVDNDRSASLDWIINDDKSKENTRRDFLAMIRGEFEAIHKTIAKIEAVEKVPLPDAPEAAPIDLTFLQKMASEGRESLPVQSGSQIIDLIVKEVLSRIETERVIRVDGNVTNSTIILGNENKSENKPKSTRKRNK